MICLDEWPKVAGRYYLGNKQSQVAVCVLASVDLLEKMNAEKMLGNIAICGKAVTENIGVEKIVQNIVSNPGIRFLILCGKESHGHYVGQAIKCLIESGVAEDGKIIGALGPMPTVKNLTAEQVETFRKQVKIIDLIDCEDAEKILQHVDECCRNAPQVFQSALAMQAMQPTIAKHVEATDVQLDPKGFFTILVDRENDRIVVEHYVAEWDEEAKKNYSGDWQSCVRSNKLDKVFHGKTAEELAHTIVRENLISRYEHAAYLGRELQKAEQALKDGKPYEQDA